MEDRLQVLKEMKAAMEIARDEIMSLCGIDGRGIDINTQKVLLIMDTAIIRLDKEYFSDNP